MSSRVRRPSFDRPAGLHDGIKTGSFDHELGLRTVNGQTNLIVYFLACDSAAQALRVEDRSLVTELVVRVCSLFLLVPSSSGLE